MAKTIQEKIRALLDMASRDTTNEHERGQALAAAQRLIDVHGLEAEQTADILVNDWTIGVVDRPWKMILGSCLHLIMPIRFIVRGDITGHVFVGKPDMIEVAEMMLVHLINEVERLYKRDLPKNMTKSERAEWRKTYKSACAHRVGLRLREIAAHNKLYQYENNTPNALAIIDNNTETVRRIDEAVQKVMRTQEVVTRTRIGLGSSAGLKAGEEVEINKKAK